MRFFCRYNEFKTPWIFSLVTSSSFTPWSKLTFNWMFAFRLLRFCMVRSTCSLSESVSSPNTESIFHSIGWLMPDFPSSCSTVLLKSWKLALILAKLANTLRMLPHVCEIGKYLKSFDSVASTWYCMNNTFVLSKPCVDQNARSSFRFSALYRCCSLVLSPYLRTRLIRITTLERDEWMRS